MLISELKQHILEEKLPKDLIIIVDKNNKFLSYQYLTAIKQFKKYHINFINSLYDINSLSSLTLFNDTPFLNVLITDVFNEAQQNYDNIINTIIICDDIDKNLAQNIEKYIIELPKFETWQLLDFIFYSCPGLTQNEQEFLLDSVNLDAFKLENELNKISLFSSEQQSTIFSNLINDTKSDLYHLTVFDLKDAIISANFQKIYEYYKHENYFEFEPFLLVNLLLKDYKQIFLLVYNGGVSADQLGITVKKANYLKYKFKNLSAELLIKIISFLSQFDLKIKKGELEISKSEQLDYIILTILLYYKNII